MSETYTTYNAARDALKTLAGITGNMRVQAGVIILRANINGNMVNITSDRAAAADHVRAYKNERREYHFAIHPNVLARFTK